MKLKRKTHVKLIIASFFLCAAMVAGCCLALSNAEKLQAQSLENQQTTAQAITVPESGDFVVYVTETGTKYHLASCRYLADTAHGITLDSAKEQGYTPCSICQKIK